MFSEFGHTWVCVFKICILNRAYNTSIFMIFKGPYETHILYSSFCDARINSDLSFFKPDPWTGPKIMPSFTGKSNKMQKKSLLQLFLKIHEQAPMLNQLSYSEINILALFLPSVFTW